MLLSSKTGRSADVRLALQIDSQTFELGQVGPDRLVLQQPAVIAPGIGTVVMSIDGREQRWQVSLPEGSNGESCTLTSREVAASDIVAHDELAIR